MSAYSPIDMLTHLSAFPWFLALPVGLREQVLAATESRRLQAGEMLFRQDDAPSCWYLLLHGRIKMSTLNAAGREAILTILDSGTWFGEISLLDGLPRTHDATALGPTELLCLHPAAFALCLADAQFAAGIATLVAGRMRLLYGIVEDAHLRTLRARVARRLLLLVGPLPLSSRIPVSQESLAMMLGMSRQSLSKELKFLSDHKVIRLIYRGIDILSLEKLTALCEKH